MRFTNFGVSDVFQFLWHDVPFKNQMSVLLYLREQPTYNCKLSLSKKWALDSIGLY